nr:MAG TPA: hypothetical protein [Bacteriophage sp.]
MFFVIKFLKSIEVISFCWVYDIRYLIHSKAISYRILYKIYKYSYIRLIFKEVNFQEMCLFAHFLIGECCDLRF